jgi:YjbE family integral membrane protein
MEIFSGEFLSALLAIVIIDLVLAGDNAIVIALAARGLPDHLRTKAVIWGTVGAIVVRSAMTLIVVWLLKIPGLLLAGGALLLWIAYKLLIAPDGDEKHSVSSATSFWTAMKTIVIADAVMGLDNVLAVAGAAHGSFLLVVLGLLISIPIVIWGSQLILKYVQKYPAIVYVGSGVLVWTGVKMMTGEPLIKDYMAIAGNAIALVYAIAMGGVLGAGFWKNHRVARSRVAAHVVDLAAEPARPVQTAPDNLNIKKKVLIPTDGTSSALQAVRHVINQFLTDPSMEVHLLHVRAPFSQHIALFVGTRNRKSYHREMAEKALQTARDLLDKHGVPHTSHIELGDTAAVIDRVAQRLGVNRIVMGTARKNTFTRLVTDSVTSRVLDTVRVPVEVVTDAAAPRWERIGVPAGVGAVLAALLIATLD